MRLLTRVRSRCLNGVQVGRHGRRAMFKRAELDPIRYRNAP
jgi:hypothetical protein